MFRERERERGREPTGGMERKREIDRDKEAGRERERRRKALLGQLKYDEAEESYKEILKYDQKQQKMVDNKY